MGPEPPFRPDGADSSRLVYPPTDWSFLPPAADALLVVPPFFGPFTPSLGVESIAAAARQAGFRAEVVYANLAFAAATGMDPYLDLFHPGAEQWGERVFARAAFGLPPFGRGGREAVGGCVVPRWEGAFLRPRPAPRLAEIEPLTEPFVDDVAAAVAKAAPRVVGFTVLDGNLAAAYALAAAVKRHRPETLTVFGGPACSGPMARGILSLGPAIDLVFEGEAERSFVGLLDSVRRGARPSRGIVANDVDVDVDALPLPDFRGYFDQVRRRVPEAEPAISLLYESCRGCWRAVHRPCAFCGFAPRPRLALKQPSIVLRDLRELAGRHPGAAVAFAEPCMHPSSFQSTVPLLAEARLGLSFSWSVRPGFTLEQAVALKAAGVALVSSGIESLSTRLLARLGKGTTARQSIATLRHCRSTGLRVMWLMLSGIPGDRLDEYTSMVDLVPLLVHLQAPAFFRQIRIVRFSPYYCDPGQYGISNIRPSRVFDDLFPRGADLESLAFTFDADCQCESTEREGALEDLAACLEAWRDRWTNGPPPVLRVRPLHGGQTACGPFVLTDTRGLPGTERTALLSREEAAAAVLETVLPARDLQSWAIERKLGVMVDGAYVPLATGDPKMIRDLEAATKNG